MEIKDYDDSLEKHVSNLDLNSKNNNNYNNNRFYKTPTVKIFKECAINTETEVVDEITQTEPCKNDNKNNNFDSTEKVLFFRGQTKEIRDLIEELQGKNRILEEKCGKSLNLLSLVNDKYRGYIEKINCEKIDFSENTCESWMKNYERLLFDSNKLFDVCEELEIEKNRTKQLEAELVGLKSENANQRKEIVELVERNERLTKEKQSIQNELNDLKDTNEFLNAENQSLSIQVDKTLEDWTATNKLHEERLRKTRMDFRKDNNEFLLLNQDLEFQFQNERMRNSEDKVEIEFLEKRIEKLLKDLANYPLLGNDLENENTDLKRKLSILEDKIIVHKQEKEKFLQYKAVIKDKVDRKSEELIKKINTLKKISTDLESDNKELRTRIDSFIQLYQDLRKINLNLENRDSEKYCQSFRAILSNFGV